MFFFLRWGGGPEFVLLEITNCWIFNDIFNLQDSHKHIPKDQQYKGLVDCFQRIHKEQGKSKQLCINF